MTAAGPSTHPTLVQLLRAWDAQPVVVHVDGLGPDPLHGQLDALPADRDAIIGIRIDDRPVVVIPLERIVAIALANHPEEP